MRRCGCVYPTALSVSVMRVSNVSTVLFCNQLHVSSPLAMRMPFTLILLAQVLLRMKYTFGGSFCFAAFGIDALSLFHLSCRGLQRLVNFKRCAMREKKGAINRTPRHRPSNPSKQAFLVDRLLRLSVQEHWAKEWERCFRPRERQVKMSGWVSTWVRLSLNWVKPAAKASCDADPTRSSSIGRQDMSRWRSLSS